MEDLELQAIRFVQNGRVFYTIAAPVGALIRGTSVDVWDADDEDDERGYQRALQATRVRSVAHYVNRDDAIMPVGGLLNARPSDEDEAAGESWGSQLEFRAYPGPKGAIESGTLVVPADALPLWTVDMQHRLAGFEYAINELDSPELANYPVVCTIADGLTKMEEIEQFELINTTQKKVATDLARQLLGRQYTIGGLDALTDPTKAWEARGAIIANWLNESGTVFGGRIIPPNKTAREAPRGVTKQTTFVSSLKPVLTAPYMQRLESEEKVAKLIDAYWSAVRGIWPYAVDNPKESIILKGPGVYPLHMLMLEVVEVVRDRGQAITGETMADAMSSWIELGDSYWDKDNTEDGATRFGSSGQGHSRIAGELRALLPTASFGSFEG